MELCKKAYNWALSYHFEPIQIEYACKLALKMLDDACKMSHEERRVFFHIYDAIVDREDIELTGEVNKLILLARDRNTIFSKQEFAPMVHACRMEVIPNMLKVHMKAYKKMVRDALVL